MVVPRLTSLVAQVVTTRSAEMRKVSRERIGAHEGVEIVRGKWERKECCRLTLAATDGSRRAARDNEIVVPDSSISC